MTGDGAEVAVATDAGDPLERGCSGDGVGGVGIEGWTGGDAGWRIVCRGSGARGIKEGVEAAGFGGRGEGSGEGEHVLRSGDDGVGTWAASSTQSGKSSRKR